MELGNKKDVRVRRIGLSHPIESYPSKQKQSAFPMFRSQEKRFYNRKTIAALNYYIQQMSLIPPLPFYATQTINPLINSRISANHD